ncbi:MAG: LysM peptidoglycan-binding domain-containing protein [Actinomycetota bacterium]|nr:LysM peptidoglycan-binding domain-containing protein [Actinomycetota bacterium]
MKSLCRCATAGAVRCVVLITAIGVEARLGASAHGTVRDLVMLLRATDGDLERAVADIAILAALAAWSWLLIVLVLMLGATLGRGAGSRLDVVANGVTPRPVRRVLLVLLGAGALAITSNPMSGVAAMTAPAACDPSGDGAPTAHPLQGLPLPDRPAGAWDGGPSPLHRRSGTVVVRPGDTLWSIAARRLGSHPEPGAVARAWPKWYTANRSVIGPDPDLIHPGIELRPPGRTGERGTLERSSRREVRR